MLGEASSGVLAGTQSDSLKIEHNTPTEGLKSDKSSTRFWTTINNDMNKRLNKHLLHEAYKINVQSKKYEHL